MYLQQTTGEKCGLERVETTDWLDRSDFRRLIAHELEFEFGRIDNQGSGEGPLPTRE